MSTVEGRCEPEYNENPRSYVAVLIIEYPVVSVYSGVLASVAFNRTFTLNAIRMLEELL
jgi:hypothetical protein